MRFEIASLSLHIRRFMLMPRKMYLAMKKNLDNICQVSSKLQLFTTPFCDSNISGLIISQFVGYRFQTASVYSMANCGVQDYKTHCATWLQFSISANSNRNKILVFISMTPLTILLLVWTWKKNIY